MPAQPGQLVKEARRGAGLTQAELAERLGTKQPVIARLESARSNPLFGTLRRALRASGYDLEAVLRPARSSVDDTMIAANLQLAPAERLERFRDSYRSLAGLTAKARRRRGP